MKQVTDEERRTAVVDAAAQRVRERWRKDEADTIERFVRLYYVDVPPEDIARSRVDNIYGAALSHWTLGHVCRPGQSHIHVYNPDPEQNGWECNHTIVQIVTEDMPFLVDSVSMALNKLGLTIHLTIHPIVATVRNRKGEITELLTGRKAEGPQHEAWMHFEVDRQTEHEQLEAIHREIATVLQDVRVSVEDWQCMVAQMDQTIEELGGSCAPVDQAHLAEVTAFLKWLRDNHFTFLGYRRYELRRSRKGDELHTVAGSGLGLLRQTGGETASQSFASLPGEVRKQARDPEPLILAKSNTRSRIHRLGYMDYIGIKRYDAKGAVIGEHRFLGLFTSAAYSHNPRSIPILRNKLQVVLDRANLRLDSHAGKALINILEEHPRDELFQASTDELYETVKGILNLQGRQRVRLFVRYDRFQRFVSCLVYAPRERYTTVVREAMQEVLRAAFGAQAAEFSVQLSESVLARIHFILRLAEPGRPEYDHAELERRLAQTLRSWTDDLAEALADYFGEERGNRMFARYGTGFSAAYREDTSARTTAHDIERLEALKEEGDLGISLYRELEAPDNMLRFKLYQAANPITLSDVLPVLEHMGVRVVDERPYDVQRNNDTACWIHDFGLSYAGAGQLEAERVRDNFQEAFTAVWQRRADDDGFNRLVLTADLPWGDIVVFRAYSGYLGQAGVQFSKSYVQETLADNPRIAKALIRFFYARFEPKGQDERKAEKLREQIEAELEEVSSLNQDRILRRILAAMQATVRTNYFSTFGDADSRGHLSLKLRPALIPDIPKPVPAFEIYVYSPRVEGVHLRGGKVARGGLRWSERGEDYRTEVLGLMKAQMVKNALIVPVGAKGGFVCKRLPEDRQAMREEVLDCYRTFIHGLLDLTDNIVEGTVVPPQRVVRHDEDDHYLVVAADKGTATFSDFANEVAGEYGFWLRDAFASGGSTGYDHKKMAITARGAWEAVKRHFRELGRDIQNDEFTAIGVGDMSGDVFGNGMLLSPHTRLVAAFDHRHIFVDPNPDTEAGYAERQRLFALDRSSWGDYDAATISAGGGVWPRTAKSIPVSAEMREALGIEANRLAPNDLISAILKAPVDLFWNGGIGTYVKSSDESHVDVGDKANDAVRVDATQLRCKVIGEGGNLGITQLARVEFAQLGGRVNTDAIDNSGGVDCSDHEVNIKILVNQVVDDGDLTMKQRNKLLVSMTDEVASLVLENNYRQTQGLTLMQACAPEMLDEHVRFMRELEREGVLDRRVEGLPDDETLTERRKLLQGLTRPELAVLLAYAKIRTYESLLHSDLVESEFAANELVHYFPQPIQERFGAQLLQHPLRNEVTATAVANRIVSRMGATFLFRVRMNTGAETAEAVRAYLAAQDIYGLKRLWLEVDRLDNQVSAQTQTRMLQWICQLHEHATQWILRNLDTPLVIEDAVERFAPAVAALTDSLDDILPESNQARLKSDVDDLVRGAVPDGLAHSIVNLNTLYSSLDLVQACARTEAPLDKAAQVYFRAGTRLNLDWLRETLVRFEAADPWQERYRKGLEDEFYVHLRSLTVRILSTTDLEATDASALVDEWAEANGALLNRMQRTLDELRSVAQVDLPMLGVALQELRELASGQ
ncbi:MAG: NAD-glutamate dehydrogenase [Acidihalobacter sp.]|uniref:NAD-glutamate dehydrogenase n=1 Tax=Acidihalobacter sp. TaxID=1872108 RepID=UPI00307F3915